MKYLNIVSVKATRYGVFSEIQEYTKGKIYKMQEIFLGEMDFYKMDNQTIYHFITDTGKKMFIQKSNILNYGFEIISQECREWDKDWILAKRDMVV